MKVRSNLLYGLLLASLFVAPATAVVADSPPLVPMRDFFRNPDKTGYQISPDGTRISWLAPYENRLNIHVRKLGEEDGVRRITEETDRDIFSYFWASNDELVYRQDKGGDENYHLYAVKVDGGGGVRELTPYEETRVSVIDELEEDPEHMIISMNRRDPRVFDVFKLHLPSGELTLQVENPGNYVGYATDHDGDVRFATASDGLNEKIYYRSAVDEPFELIEEASWKSTFSPLQFTYDNEKVWVVSDLGRDKDALVLYDPETRTEEEVIYQHPQVDLLSAEFSDKREKLLGVSFLAAFRTFVYFDEQRKDLHRSLEERLPGFEVRLADHSDDETKWLVRTFSDRSKGAYYFYYRETDELRKLADVSPWLTPGHMADMEPITYESRDGLFIHGYLTLPTGVAAEDLPLIVLPHGGPQARDSWGFRAQPQFLANRGYAVLQPNFRGSTGYGKRFMEIGFGEWGRKMQNDLTDGVRHLVDKGIADPERVGIYGASYGGYAALAGITFTPDVYAAGVSYVGPSNLFTLLDSIPPYWEPMRESMYEMIGHPEKDEERLRAISPLFHIDQLQDPLLILQGANDPRVKQAESDQIVTALRERGIDVAYLLKENEGHGFANEENRFDAYRAIEEFFADHLGGRVEEGKASLPELYE